MTKITVRIRRTCLIFYPVFMKPTGGVPSFRFLKDLVAPQGFEPR